MAVTARHIFIGSSDKSIIFVSSLPQATVIGNPFCKKAGSWGKVDGIDWYQCEHHYQCPGTYVKYAIKIPAKPARKLKGPQSL